MEQANAWRDSGERSAAHFLAHTTGVTVTKAEETLSTARRLEELPATADAFRSGSLSETQTAEVAAAAAQSPASERRLLDTAGRSTLKQLRDECRRVRLAATDQRATYERIKAERHLVTWTDTEGAYCGRFRTTPDAGARIAAGLDAEIERVFRAARTEERHEPRATYAIDALETLVGGTGAHHSRVSRNVEIGVLIDYGALLRGHSLEGETCEIAGLGPVPVAAVESWRNDAYLRLIVTDGVDVKAITRRTRYVDAYQQAARERGTGSASSPAATSPGASSATTPPPSPRAARPASTT